MRLSDSVELSDGADTLKVGIGPVTTERFQNLSKEHANWEGFHDMREDLDKERKFMGRQWAKRETQILAVVDSTVGMVGDLQAIAGKAMPDIPSLELPLLEDSTEPKLKAL
jgi:hypothetical protein